MKLKRESLYKLMACLFPIFILMLVEILLRVFNYGRDLSLFVQDKRQPYLLHLNNKVSLRYFLNESNATNGNVERFFKKKPDGLVRIFVQGESTAVGFPYFHNGAFPRMMEYQLRTDFPTLKLELINLSMTALNSYALYDFVDEIIEQRPDAVVINVGHNEYYGALGVGSTSSYGSNVFISRLGIELRKTKIGQLISAFFSSFSFERDNSDYSQTLMKRMVRSQEIPFKSDIYYAGLMQFEKNLDDALAKYEEAGILVFLTNTISNLKDQKPFLSIGSDKRENAATCFIEAEKYYKKGDYFNAKQKYLQAKELDVLRFRAPEEINRIIKELSDKYNCVEFVDVNKFVENSLSDGIIGKEIMLEHLHPNLRGHYLITEAILTGFQRRSFLYSSDSICYKPLSFGDLPLTPVDSIKGVYATLLLKEGWPFDEPIEKDAIPENKTMEEAIAGGFAVNTLKWELGMTKLLDYYISIHNYEMAIKVCEGFILEYPHEIMFYERLVNLYIDAGKCDEAVCNANRLCQYDGDYSKVIQKLVICLLKKDEPTKALPFIDYIISKRSSVDFKPMRDVVEKIIFYKAKLSLEERSDSKKKIFSLYKMIGNEEAAKKYEN